MLIPDAGHEYLYFVRTSGLFNPLNNTCTQVLHLRFHILVMISCCPSNLSRRELILSIIRMALLHICACALFASYANLSWRFFSLFPCVFGTLVLLVFGSAASSATP